MRSARYLERGFGIICFIMQRAWRVFRLNRFLLISHGVVARVGMGAEGTQNPIPRTAQARIHGQATR